MTAGRSRCGIDLFETPDFHSKADEALNRSDIPVDILEESDGWLKVRWTDKDGHPCEGFTPQAAVVRPSDERKGLFPALNLPDGRTVLSVPAPVKWADFNAWLNAGGRPAWIPEADWDLLPAEQQQAAVEAIRAVKIEHAADYDAWVLEVSSHFRRDEAEMGEWEIFLGGGREMLVVASGYIDLLPDREDLQVERAEAGDILHWNGLLHRVPGDPPGGLWYKVLIFKQGSPADGWVPSELLDPYTYPGPEIDPAVADNVERVFDLSRPALRSPQDKVVLTARKNALAAHWGGAQFIDVAQVVGHPINTIDGRHYKLCGEFCCATVAGKDIYDLLKDWKRDNPDTAMRVLTEHVGTSAYELKNILRIYGINARSIDMSKSRDELTASRLREQFAAGKAAITGVKVGNVHQGRLDPNQTVDHWVVLEDVIPAGTDGWVRIYNPYLSQEEVYTFATFLTCFWKFPLWIWVDNPNHPAQA